MKKGFTLVELLVVILIIAILSAIALPMYFRAIEKSRATEALSILKSLSESVQRAGKLHGTVTWDMIDIDVDGGTRQDTLTVQTANFTYSISGNRPTFVVSARRNEGPGYEFEKTVRIGGANGSDILPTICLSTNPEGETACKNLGFTETTNAAHGTGDGWTAQ